MIEDLKLVRPSVHLQVAFLAMAEDFRLAGDDRFQGMHDLLHNHFADFVRRLHRMAQGLDLKPGWVPQTTFWSITPRASIVIGMLQLRHQLTSALEKEGGHIGYSIVPSWRGQGYGTRQLALGLEKARVLGLDRVLITCDTDNIASARVIQKNGGQFEDEVISDYSGKLVSRYWIRL